MVKKKIRWKWLAAIAGVTALAVAVSLCACILTAEEVCAPGFTCDGFVPLYSNGSTLYMASSDGNVYALEGMGTAGSITTTSYLSVTSLNRKTMVYPQLDGTFTVISPYGVRVLEQKVPLSGLVQQTAQPSFDGNIVYFFARDAETSGNTALWRYDAKEDTATQLDTFTESVVDAVVSPKGDCFAVIDGTYNARVYAKETTEVQTRAVSSEAKLFFLTDNGVLFFKEPIEGLQSLNAAKEIYAFPHTQVDNLAHVLFNRDATEMLVNLETGGCFWYTLKQGVVQDSVQLKESGNLELFMDDGAFSLLNDNMQKIQSTNHTIVGVDSLRQMNLRDAETGERVKLTKDNALIYQENSASMYGDLAPGGQYIIYMDADADRFYTDTADEKGTYHLLWELPDFDEYMLMVTTGQKSYYYLDKAYNLCYTKLGKDTILSDAEEWNTVTEWSVEDATDTLYYIADDAIYYAREGARPRRVAKLDRLFPEEMTGVTLSNTTTAGMYCFAHDAQTGEPMFYRLYADGSYQLVD